MKRRMTGVAKAAGGLALAGSILVATALPAAAASPNRAYAASAGGRISQSPLGVATFPGSSPVILKHANIGGLLTTGVATDAAGPTSASSTVASVAGSLGKLVTLTATAVTSSCSFNTNTGKVTGTAGITRGRVTGVTPITLAANPAPNTHVTVPGIGIITLNRQITASDGTLMVQAVHVALLGTVQSFTVGVSVCNAANLAPVPILPGKSAEVALGALGLLLLCAAGYQVSRRRRRVLAA